MSVTLIAYPLDDSNVEVPYVLDTMGDIDIAMTFSIQNIEDFTSLRGSSSKTITLPNTPTNQQCFGFAYNIQSFMGGFTPNKKIRAAMWDDGVQVFSGVLQLLSMAKTRGKVTYEVGLFTDEVNLYKSLEGKLLTDLNVSGYNHTTTSGIVTDTWASGGLGSGYVYGLFDDFGWGDANPNYNSFSFTIFWWLLKPSFYVKTLVDKIFEESGFSYSSNFFNSTEFKRLVIPYAGSKQADDLSAKNFYVGSTGTVSVNADGIVYSFMPDDQQPFYPQNDGYWLVTGSPAYSVFYAPSVTTWNFNFTLDITNDSGVDAGFEAFIAGYPPAGNLLFYRPIGQWFVLNGETIEVNFAINNIQMPANLECFFAVKFVDINGDPITSGIHVNSSKLLGYCLQDSFSVLLKNMKRALPANIKQTDLLSDLQKMFNLLIMPSPSNPKLLVIEPWASFYNENAIDWTSKVDENAEQLIQIGDINQYRTLLFKFKDSNDYLGNLFKNRFTGQSVGYGERKVITTNFGAKNEKTVETTCSTLIPAQFTQPTPFGRTWSISGQQLQFSAPSQTQGVAVTSNIQLSDVGYRIAQFNYTSMPYNTYWYLANSIFSAFSSYQQYSDLPWISHIDNPWHPTNDLLFGMPRQIFYVPLYIDSNGNLIGPNYTNNNLYNRYWKNYVTELTSKESMQIELTVMLNAYDIQQFTFAAPVYYNGIKFRVIEIRDYIVGELKPCRVTLRRILNLSDFVATNVNAVFFEQNTIDPTLQEIIPQINT